MKEVFLVNMTKKKDFKEKELSSIKIEAKVSRRVVYEDDKELFIGSNTGNDITSLGIITIERTQLDKETEIGDKVHICDVIPYLTNEQNLYRFINDRRIFERLIEEMVALMGRVDKDDVIVEFVFYCNIDSIKYNLLQAMKTEMESKLKEFVKDRFFEIEPAIIKAYKGDKNEL